MNIKTFPLQFTEEKLNEIRKKADSINKTIKQYILDLIEENLKEGR